VLQLQALAPQQGPHPQPDRRAAQFHPVDAEVSVPAWVFGQSRYLVLPDGTVVTTHPDGRDTVITSIPEDGSARSRRLENLTVRSIAHDGERVMGIVSFPDRPVEVRSLPDGEVLRPGAGPQQDRLCRFAPALAARAGAGVLVTGDRPPLTLSRAVRRAAPGRHLDFLPAARLGAALAAAAPGADAVVLCGNTRGLDVVSLANADSALSGRIRNQVLIRRHDTTGVGRVVEALGDAEVIESADSTRLVDLTVLLGKRFRVSKGY